MKEFADALCRFVGQEIIDQDGAYIEGAVRVMDARNHLFISLPHQSTDEANDIYALADLCRLDDEMNTVPDHYRAIAVARNYF